MSVMDRARLAARTFADYEGYGYADLLVDDINAIAGVAQDIADAELLPVVATKSAVAATQSNGITETITLNIGATNVAGALLVGHQTDVSVNSTGGALTGAGHVIGTQTTLNISTTGTVTHTLMIAQESSFKHLGTSATTSLLYGHVVHPLDIEGTVAFMAGYHVEMASGDIDPAATVVVSVDFNSPNWSALPKLPLIRYSHWNQDPGKILRTDGVLQLASGQEGIPAPHAGVALNRYYCGMCPTGLTPAALTANIIYFVPTFIPARTTLKRIGCRVTTLAAASSVQMAIYRAVAGVPSGAALLTTSSISSATTGDKEATIDLLLEAGEYIFAVVSNGIPTINWMTDVGLFGAIGGTTSNGLETTMTFSGTFGTWPSSPAVAWSAVGGAVPQVWWRVV